ARGRRCRAPASGCRSPRRARRGRGRRVLPVAPPPVRGLVPATSPADSCHRMGFDTGRTVGPPVPKDAPIGPLRVHRIAATLGCVIGPRTLRLAVAVVAVVAAGVLATSAVATSRSETQLSTLNHQVLVLINKFRAAHHLHALKESPHLAASATEHSMQMGADGYFAHPSANGTAFWKRIQHYFSSRNYAYWSVG